MTDSAGETGDGDPLRALAGEAGRLIAMAQQWLHRAVVDPQTSPLATGGSDCAGCPLCQLIRILREAADSSASPEAVVAEAISNIQAAASSMWAAWGDVLRPRPGSAE